MNMRTSYFLSPKRTALMLPAGLAVLFLLPGAAFCAWASAVPEDRQAIQETPVFSKHEANASRRNPGYFTINPRSIRITLIETRKEPDMNYVRLQETPPKDTPSNLVLLDSMDNIASKTWQIVLANAPVANIDTKYATAYPLGIASASQLARWSGPKTYSYGFYAENIYGAVMIDCKYKVSYSYGGAYKGKGKYLTGVTIIPTVTSVGWGYKLYMSASVPDSTIANVGTDINPIAAMQLKLIWKMATAIKEVDGTSVYYVQGDGYFKEIASPWKQSPDVAGIKAASPLLEPEKVF
ncbi:MAG TPA: hypothetical protein DCS63_01615 [Elusimicrobia bacterium]|nr:hypothetical protein [Elusimicrobiota bacterium]